MSRYFRRKYIYINYPGYFYVFCQANIVPKNKIILDNVIFDDIIVFKLNKYSSNDSFVRRQFYYYSIFSRQIHFLLAHLSMLLHNETKLYSLQ